MPCTYNSSEGRLELWQKSKNTNHLFDSELEQTNFFFFSFLFLIFGMTKLGPVFTVLNLMDVLYRWRHGALGLVVFNMFHLESQNVSAGRWLRNHLV